MDDIADLETLRSHLEHLQAKGLVQSLTPPGRGHVITHGLYEARELEAERAKFSAMAAAEVLEDEAPRTVSSPAPAPRPTTPAQIAASSTASHDLNELKAQLADLRSEVSELRQLIAAQDAELRRLRDALGG
jgi:hypothetical protein